MTDEIQQCDEFQQRDEIEQRVEESKIESSREERGLGSKRGLPPEVLDESDPRVVLLRELAEEAAVSLYDVVFPPGRSGVVQVLIAPRVSSSSEIGHDDCNRLARLVLDSERVEELLPGSATLEVSSPGINRAIRSVVQLKGAIGERIRISAQKYRDDETGDQIVARNKVSTSSNEGAQTFGAGVIRGVLQELTSDGLKMVDEVRKRVIFVAIGDVKEARVDFPFDMGGGKTR
jgi:ribosome maturation factor RimP